MLCKYPALASIVSRAKYYWSFCSGGTRPLSSLVKGKITSLGPIGVGLVNVK